MESQDNTPHRSETNGIAERAVRRVGEGTSASLLQSGGHERWWSDSMECYCDLRNVQDLSADGKLLMKDDSENYSWPRNSILEHWFSVIQSQGVIK